MKRCTRWKYACRLLVCLIVLPLTTYGLAADKKGDKMLLNSDRIVVPVSAVKLKSPVKRKTSPAPMADKAPVKGRRPLVPAVPIHRPAPLARPSTYSHATPTLPRVPVPRAAPVAPPVLNPRSQAGHMPTGPKLPGGDKPGKKNTVGFASPEIHHLARPAKPVHFNRGAPTVPGTGFSLSPLTRPESGLGRSRGSAGQHATGSSSTPHHVTGRGGFAPQPSVSNRPPGSSSGGNTSTLRPDTTISFSARNHRSKDDERSGEVANNIVNDWAEDDMAIGGGKVPDPDDADIVTPPSPGKETSPGVVEYSNGTITSKESNGSAVTVHSDGRTDTFDTEGGLLETPSGIKTTPGANGGTDVEDRASGVTGHFGAENVRNDGGEIKDSGSGHGDLPGGGRITDESNGSVSVDNVDGSRDTWQRDGSHLHTDPGIKTVASPDGGTDVIDPDGKFEAHFGGGETTTERGEPKYTGGGTVQNPDGSKEPGKKPSYYSSSSDDSTDSSSSSDDSSSSGSSSDDSADDSSDDDSSSDDSADSSDDNSDSSDDSSDSSDDSSDSSDDSGDDDSSDESSVGFEGARGGDGGPEPAAKTTVDDRVARMKGEKRNPESPDDPEPGNGGSAPDSVSQPGPGGGHGGSPLTRPSADGHQSPIGKVVAPTVKSRSSVGGGDCFKPDGCDNSPTGGFQLDPFDRDPVTNPGDH